jgi:hypothetical protein
MNDHLGSLFASRTPRRNFLQFTLAATAASIYSPLAFAAAPGTPLILPRRKRPGLIRGAFFYPPAEVVEAGLNEDNWSKHKWHTWPGNQFQPEAQEKTFRTKLAEMTQGLDLDLRLEEKAIYTDAGIQAFISSLDLEKPAALLLFNFWNTFSAKIIPIMKAWDGPVILYHPVGANHQLPPEFFRTAPRTQYIHSIENWPALERGLRAVHTMTRMRQSKILQVSGSVTKATETKIRWFDMPMDVVPAHDLNEIFDETPVSREMRSFARSVRRSARRITDVSESSFLDAARIHTAVGKLMDTHQADAITIECLFLKHRKPCISFAVNNGNLVPCGCEKAIEATLTMMLGTNLFSRGGFQHNPEFDTEQNLYFASHCTCTTRLHGPAAKAASHDFRPFFHQLPKTPALDVQWPKGEPVTLAKFLPGKPALMAYSGKVIDSPASPPTGGCATRVLVKLDNVADVCTAYNGPHPVLFCGDFVEHFKTFAKLYEMELKTNS